MSEVATILRLIRDWEKRLPGDEDPRAGLEKVREVRRALWKVHWKYLGEDRRFTLDFHPDDMERADPPEGAVQRRIFYLAGMPECGVWIPDAWAGVVLEAVQQLLSECPGIGFAQIKEKFGGLRIYYELNGPREKADAIIEAADRAVQEIDGRLGIDRCRGLRS